MFERDSLVSMPSKYINISISDSLLGLGMRLVKGMEGRKESMQSAGEKIKYSLIISSRAALPLLCPAALTLKS